MNINKIILKSESILHTEIEKSVRIENKYGTNKQIYKLISSDQSYLLKFCRDNSLYEADGYKSLGKYIPLPRLLYAGLVEGKAILLYDYISSSLLTDILLDNEDNGQESSFLEIEDRKNKLLTDMYSKTLQKISAEDYLNSATNKLFYGRLFGDRFKEYYLMNKSTLNLGLKKEIVLNGVNVGNCQDIINSIKLKYDKFNSKDIDAIQGHGDAHHQNILLTKSGKLYFIDFEHVGKIPISMELSKPYYIDFIGTLFFFFEEKLLKYFVFEQVKESVNLIDLKVKINSLPETRIKIAENKISHFGKLINNSKDVLSLNDYLVLSHLLSRNPNNYSTKTQYLFLITLILLAKFDPLEPRTLFKFFL